MRIQELADIRKKLENLNIMLLLAKVFHLLAVTLVFQGKPFIDGKELTLPKVN